MDNTSVVNPIPWGEGGLKDPPLVGIRIVPKHMYILNVNKLNKISCYLRCLLGSLKKEVLPPSLQNMIFFLLLRLGQHAKNGTCNLQLKNSVSLWPFSNMARSQILVQIFACSL